MSIFFGFKETKHQDFILEIPDKCHKYKLSPLRTTIIKSVEIVAKLVLSEAENMESNIHRCVLSSHSSDHHLMEHKLSLTHKQGAVQRHESRQPCW